MRGADVFRTLDSIGIDISYQNIANYSNGNKLPWKVSYYLSKNFPVKDTLEWRNSKIEELIELIIPYYKNMEINGYKPTTKHRYIGKSKKQRRISKLRRIQEKYGAIIFKDFKTVKNVPFHSLTWLSDKYKFSREYARQLYEFIYNIKFKDSLKAKNLKLKETQCVHHPARKVADYKKNNIVYQGALAEKLFMDKCLKLGFNISIPCDADIDIIVNKYMIDVKSCGTISTMAKRAKTKYYQFSISPAQRSLCHFFALYNIIENFFYIVPNKERGTCFKKVRSIFISSKKSSHYNAKNKYHEFKNRFDLLKEETARDLKKVYG